MGSTTPTQRPPAMAGTPARTRSATRAAASRSRRPPPPPRAPKGWALAGLALGLFAALVFFAPAQWLAGTLAQASGQQLVLAQARGTVWSGSAQLVLSGGAQSQDRAALPGRVQWQLRPRWWGLSLLLQADCCTSSPLRMALAPRWGGARVVIGNSQSQWPAQVLSGLGTPWNTLQPQGRLALQTQGVSLEWAQGRMQLDGQLQLDALAMSSRLSSLRPMGSYRLLLAGSSASAPSLTLQTLEGHLRLSGSGQWVGSRLHFTGEASAAPDDEAQLSNLLNIIGRRSGPRSVISLG